MIPLNINISTPIHLHFPLSRPTPFLLPSLSLLNVKSTPGSHNYRRKGLCRVELNQDTTISIAIGACMLNTYFFTRPPGSDNEGSADADDEDEEAAMGSTDARFAVMTVISVIPFFNWLSWVFALMDTGKRRYAVYALVYLAPYIRTNLSLSPDESWLPIASIALCIIHIQLEASARNGDFESFNLFNEIGKRLGFLDLKKDSQVRSSRKRHEEERRRDNNRNLPLEQLESRNEINNSKLLRKPSEEDVVGRHVNEDGSLDDRTKH